MDMKRAILLSCGALLAVFAPPVMGAPMSLHDCITQAVTNSPDLASSRHLIAAARADITKKRGTQLPYFSGQLQGYTVNGQPVSQFSTLNLAEPSLGVGPNRFTPQAHWGWPIIEELSLSYPLFYEGSIMGLNDPPPVATSRATMQEDQANALVAQQKVIFNVVTAYLNAASFATQYEAQERVAKIYERQLEIERAEQRLGLKLPQDVEVAQAELASANEAAGILNQAAHSNQVQLAGLVGGQTDYTIEVDRTPPPLTKLPPLDEFIKQVVPNNPALMVQRAKVEVSRQQLRVDKVGHWPTATLNNQFLAGQDLEHFSGGEHHQRPTLFQSYITIDLPIFDFGQRTAANRESEENLLAAKDELRATEESVRTSITQVYGEISDQARTITALQSTAIELEKQAALSRAQRAAGTIDELTLVGAEIAAANANAEVESAQLLERLQYASLQNLAGGLWLWVQ
jgi:outer membrane protein TolC